VRRERVGDLLEEREALFFGFALLDLVEETHDFLMLRFQKLDGVHVDLPMPCAVPFVLSQRDRRCAAEIGTKFRASAGDVDVARSSRQRRCSCTSAAPVGA
jgi:hypothetical protein